METEEDKIHKEMSEIWIDYFNLVIWPELSLGIGMCTETLLKKITIEKMQEDLQQEEDELN